MLCDSELIYVAAPFHDPRRLSRVIVTKLVLQSSAFLFIHIDNDTFRTRLC